MTSPIKNIPLNVENVAQALQQAGIEKGDVVCVHSFLGAFGLLKDGAQTVLDGFLSAIGETGTLIVPTYNYDFCQGTPYVHETTPSQVGQFGDFCRKQKRFKRTLHPVYSHAVTGRAAEYFLENPSTNGFGQDSLFERFHKINGRLVGFGVDFNSLTFFHYLEDRLRVPYRFLKEFSGQVTENGETRFYTAQIYSRYLELDPKPLFGLEHIQQKLLAKGVAKKSTLERGEIVAVLARDCYEESVKEYREDPMCFLKQPVDLSQIPHEESR